MGIRILYYIPYIKNRHTAAADHLYWYPIIFRFVERVI